jgi:ferredoxin
VELVDITSPGARTRRLRTAHDELLVVAVPVYSGRVPELACSWLRTIEADATPAACLVVYGNRAIDDALLELTDIVRERGGIPVAGAAFIGEHSFSNAATPIAAGRPDADDLHRAERFGRTVRERVTAMRPDAPAPSLVVPGSRPYRDRQVRPPGACSAAGDACVQCGVCAEVCPAGAIDPHDSAVVDDHACVLCCACIKRCPEGARAVQAGWLKEIAVRLRETCSARREPECFL